MTSKDIDQLAENPELIEIGRKHVEDMAVLMRDSGISVIRGNGICIREPDGTPSANIRFGPEDALVFGLRAIARHLESEASK